MCAAVLRECQRRVSRTAKRRKLKTTTANTHHFALSTPSGGCFSGGTQGETACQAVLKVGTEKGGKQRRAWSIVPREGARACGRATGRSVLVVADLRHCATTKRSPRQVLKFNNKALFARQPNHFFATDCFNIQLQIFHQSKDILNGMHQLGFPIFSSNIKKISKITTKN